MPTQLRKSGRKPKLATPLLWNPGTAMLFSLVLTPIFGAAVHMLNWRTLHETRYAKESLWWGVAGCAILLAGPIFSLADAESRTMDTGTVTLLFFYLVGWLALPARRQLAYVRKHFPKGYGRRPWGMALAISLAAYLAYLGAGLLLAWLGGSLC